MIILNRRKNFQRSSQLMNEQFEGPGSSGWTYTSSSTAAAWNDQYSIPPVLAGTYSARIQATSATLPNRINAQKIFGNSRNVYCRFLIKHQVYANANTTLAAIRNLGGTNLGTFAMLSGNHAARATAFGGTTQTAVDNPVIGTLYYGWFEYERGTGSNSVCRTGYSLTPVRPTWPNNGGNGLLAVSNNGNNTSTPDRIMFGSTAVVTGYDVIIDDIQIQSTPFA
jgi:hypothetical protein